MKVGFTSSPLADAPSQAGWAHLSGGAAHPLPGLVHRTGGDGVGQGPTFRNIATSAWAAPCTPSRAFVCPPPPREGPEAPRPSTPVTGPA